jgi:Flp pilus assembly protein TadG
MKLRIRHKSGSKGSALVETALCLTVFCAFLFGLMELGLALYSYHSLSQIAREGSRWAAVRGHTSCLTSSHIDHCDASAADIKTYVAGLGYLGIGTGNVVVVWCNKPTGGTVDTTCSQTDLPGNMVKVTVTYSTQLALPMISTNALSLSSTSQMMVTQ